MSVGWVDEAPFAECVGYWKGSLSEAKADALVFGGFVFVVRGSDGVV